MVRSIGVAGASVLLLLVACGGATVGSGRTDGGGDDGGGASSSGAGGSSGGTSSGSSGGASGGSSSGSGGSSGGPGPGPCPSSVPAPGGACSSHGVECEYGGSGVQGCDTIATCSSNGVWGVQGPTLSDCGTHAAGCPATYAAVPQGTSCSANGLVCDYPQGRCECASGGGPIRLVDGSVAIDWFCQNPGTGCPPRRPALGSACTMANQSCDYGSCTVEGGTAVSCSNGVWQMAFVGCPL